MKSQKISLSIWQKILLFSTGSISLIGILIFFSIWQVSDRAMKTIAKMFNFQPTQPKVEMTSTIIKQVRDIEELTTTVYKMEAIIPTSVDRKWGDVSIASTRLLYIGRGEVRAGIDFARLTENDIQIDDNSVQINLPAPQILDSKVDIENSRVYDYDRGFLNLGPDAGWELQTLAQEQTLERVVNSACKEGILLDANKKAEQTIAKLLVNIDRREIKVKTKEPVNNTCNNS